MSIGPPSPGVDNSAQPSDTIPSHPPTHTYIHPPIRTHLFMHTSIHYITVDRSPLVLDDVSSRARTHNPYRNATLTREHAHTLTSAAARPPTGCVSDAVIKLTVAPSLPPPYAAAHTFRSVPQLDLPDDDDDGHHRPSPPTSDNTVGIAVATPMSFPFSSAQSSAIAAEAGSQSSEQVAILRQIFPAIPKLELQKILSAKNGDMDAAVDAAIILPQSSSGSSDPAAAANTAANTHAAASQLPPPAPPTGDFDLAYAMQVQLELDGVDAAARAKHSQAQEAQSKADQMLARELSKGDQARGGGSSSGSAGIPLGAHITINDGHGNGNGNGTKARKGKKKGVAPKPPRSRSSSATAPVSLRDVMQEASAHKAERDGVAGSYGVGREAAQHHVVLRQLQREFPDVDPHVCRTLLAQCNFDAAAARAFLRPPGSLSTKGFKSKTMGSYRVGNPLLRRVGVVAVCCCCCCRCSPISSSSF